MKIEELSTNINLIIDILDKVFAKADSYQINSTSYDEVNDQLDIKIYYEFQNNLEFEFHSDMFIVGIPDYVLNPKAFKTDIENFIEIMRDIIDIEMNNH
ncbi:MAG: hypothetical protein J1F35_08360 [Erysipelotrichales bacterium]|nr:hypothetical protein [Erysipelotrichales bacterium]